MKFSKNRLQDLVTLLRLALSPLILLIPTPLPTLIVFSLLFFSDYLDGLLARNYPDPLRESRFYNRLPITFDNIADISLFLSGLAWILLKGIWSMDDLTLAIIVAIVFAIARFLQDSNHIQEPFKTYAATVAMWCFGFAVVFEVLIFARATAIPYLRAVILSLLAIVLVLRGKANINSSSKRH